MVKRGPRYTPEEAEARIQDVARRLTMEAVDLVIALDAYPLDSHEVERRVWSLSGQVGFLSRLCHVVWKYRALKNVLARGTT